jgi:hypothetical protein
MGGHACRILIQWREIIMHCRYVVPMERRCPRANAPTNLPVTDHQLTISQPCQPKPPKNLLVSHQF